MGHYRVIGKPNIPHGILIDNPVGAEVDAELDKDEEKLLIDIGAIEKLPAKRSGSHAKSSKSEAKSSDKEKS